MSNSEKPDAEDLKAELAKKSQLFARVFNTDDGQEVLDHLKGEFVPRDIINKCQTVTDYKLGIREAYLYIEALVEKGNEHE